MEKRTLATVLWLFAGWYVGNMIAALVGADALLGPAIGVGAAILFGGDPFHVVWPRAERTATSTVQPAPEPS